MQHLVTLYTTPRSIDTWEPAEWWTLGERSTLDTETSPEDKKEKPQLVDNNHSETNWNRQNQSSRFQQLQGEKRIASTQAAHARWAIHVEEHCWHSSHAKSQRQKQAHVPGRQYTASLWTTCKTTRSSDKKNARVEQGSPSPSPPCTSAFSGWLPSPTPSVVARKPGPQLKGSESESGTENLFLLENIGEDEQVLTLLARLENLRDKMLSLMFDITGEQFTNISVFAVPPKESRMNCVSLLFR